VLNLYTSISKLGGTCIHNPLLNIKEEACAAHVYNSLPRSVNTVVKVTLPLLFNCYSVHLFECARVCMYINAVRAE